MKRTVYVTMTKLIDGAYITMRRAKFAAVGNAYRLIGFESQREAVRFIS